MKQIQFTFIALLSIFFVSCNKSSEKIHVRYVISGTSQLTSTENDKPIHKIKNNYTNFGNTDIEKNELEKQNLNKTTKWTNSLSNYATVDDKQTLSSKIEINSTLRVEDFHEKGERKFVINTRSVTNVLKTSSDLDSSKYVINGKFNNTIEIKTDTKLSEGVALHLIKKELTAKIKEEINAYAKQ
ncbi:hypothetical protein BZG01_07285 [Labilibaculum manganireducens]|uniref:Uncharacterized protein n=1 Tax=Labilibaculum manganireducens TaxID=1940525 RepID=A0A2N3IB26_9BACT|nr:hypothetical protein [Labilibaculum manganireducens]PKQ67532.1 hypothetical protein BZG01_07285 [Labilibaculum manganireducens]